MPEMFGAGLLLLLMGIFGFIGAKFKIPEVVIYILLGFSLSGWLSGNDMLHFIGEVGIVLLFFMLGMEFPIKELIKIAKKVTPAGTIDVILSFGVTSGICLLAGIDLLMSMIIGGVVYATSSSITMKMLESSKRTANPESEFMLGVLIFEDLVAPVMVAIFVALTAGEDITVTSMSLLGLQVVGLIVLAICLGHFIFSKLGPFFIRHLHQDVFILFVVSIALSYGGLALYFELSEVLGAFLAGIIVAEARRTHELEGLMLPLRDLTLPLFFVYFGTSIDLSEGIPMIGLLIAVFIWSVIAKLVVGYYGGQWYGLSKKVALRAGLSFTQRGEFSIIMASLATTEIMAFSSVYILISAMFGIVLFSYAPKISKKLFGNGKGKSGKSHVPEG